MKQLQISKRLCALLCLGLVAHGVAVADDGAKPEFEDLDAIAVESVLPAKFLHSAHYAIAPLVRAEDNFYRFTVTTDKQTYQITSIAMLRVRLHEIATIAELEPRLAASEISLQRLPRSRRGVESEHVVDIIADPIGTAAQLLGNIEYNVEQTFLSQPTGGGASRAPRSGQDLNPGPHKRSAASQLGVDVYSSNVDLQRILTAVGEARSAGKTATSISPLIRNVFAERDFGSGVLNARLESHLKNTGSQDLHEQIEGSLVELGVPRSTQITFLTHPAYTPRTRLYLTTFATLLAPVRHIDLLLAAANQATTEADALAYVGYMRMLAHHQLHSSNLVEVITEARFPVLATNDGNAVLALPLDYLAWTGSVAAAADTLRSMRLERQLGRFVVLLAGVATETTRNQLEQRQVEVLQNYSYQ